MDEESPDGITKWKAFGGKLFQAPGPDGIMYLHSGLTVERLGITADWALGGTEPVVESEDVKPSSLV